MPEPRTRSRPTPRCLAVGPLAAGLLASSLAGVPGSLAKAQLVRPVAPEFQRRQVGPAPPLVLDQPPPAGTPSPGGVFRLPPTPDQVPTPPPAQPPAPGAALPPAILDQPAAETFRSPSAGSIIEAVEAPTEDVELHVNRSKLFRLNRELSRDTIVSYDNENVVAVQFLNDPEDTESKLRYLNLFGNSFGYATVTLIDQERDVIQTLKVRVTIDSEALEQRLNSLFPGADVRVRQVAQNVILEGQVPDAKTMADLLELVRSDLRISGQTGVGSLTGSVYGNSNQSGGLGGGMGGAVAPGGGMGQGQQGQNVSVNSGSIAVPNALANQRSAQPGLTIINRVYVPGPRQVMLKVKIAEINRTALRQLGVNWQRVTGGDVLGSLIGGVADITNQAGVTAAGTNTQLFGIFDEGNFSLYLNALRRNDLARILAEPTLVTLDGQPAQFLAGGEFPYPVAQIGGGGSVPAITIQFRDYGAVLQFLPFIVEDDAIRLDVEPVFSELNFATGTSVLGTSVPGLNVRSARTVVQMREGQTLAIAGLFSTRTRGSVERVPLVGDLPVVGQLFSRNEIQTEETELVVLVTPELVEAVDRQAAPGPGETYLEPNDYEFYFLGRLEGRTGHPHRATLQYLDPFEIMKHFRSEDHWVVGPHGFAD